MQFPIIHLNGTKGEDLLEQYVKAITAVKAAVKAVSEIECHGRDYYPISGEAASVAYREQMQRLTKLREVETDLHMIADNIVTQIGTRNIIGVTETGKKVLQQMLDSGIREEIEGMKKGA